MNKFLHPRSIAVAAILLLFVCFPIVISAIPAAPFPGKVVQPDGTTLTVRLTGDEFAHITVTTDGYTLVEETGGYYYAQAGTDGTLVSTGVLAHDPEDRQANETALLQNTPKGIRVKKEIKQPRRRLNKALLQSGAAGNDNVLVSGGYPLRGKTRSLVILVEFNDIDFVTPDTYNVFNDMLNKPGYDKREHIGCAADYFRIQSGGLFDPSFDVYGPVRASKASTYYGENDAAGDDMYVWELVLEVCRKLDDQINFADYDLDGDGCVDNVYLFYAGYGENFAGNKAAWIWPHAYYMHAWNLPDQEVTFDGVKIDSYGCCAELYGSTGTDTGAMGTFCHEFGHILGLPDTYDVNYSEDGSGNHPDQWDIMASGSYLPATRNCGAVPAGYTGLERYMLGWGEPVELTKPQTVSLPSLQENNTFLRISTPDPNEFYILENRQQRTGSYDRYIPSHGLLIWHVDRRTDATVSVTIGGERHTLTCMELWDLDYNSINSNADHQCLEIEKASGNSGSKSTLDTPFPGRQMKTSFTDTTDPSMKTWNGTALDKPITNIRELSGVITFDFCGGGEGVKMQAIEPTQIGENAFTARWTADEKADEYRLHVWRVNRSIVPDMTSIDQTFPALPEDWTLEGDATYESESIIMASSRATTLATPPIDLSRGGKLTIRARQYQSSGGTISIYHGDTFIGEYPPSDLASNYTVTIPASSAAAAPLRFSASRRKPVAIERVTLVQDLPVTEKEIADGYPILTGNVSSFVVNGLDKGTEYAYAVEAVGYVGSISNDIFVTTAGMPTSIDEAAERQQIYITPDGILHIQGFDSPVTVTVRDIAGRTTNTFTAESPAAVPLDFLAESFHLITVDNGKKAITVKFLKRR